MEAILSFEMVLHESETWLLPIYHLSGDMDLATPKRRIHMIVVPQPYHLGCPPGSGLADTQTILALYARAALGGQCGPVRA